ncbi:MAG: PIN domain-containing protein [Thermomicrobiales bacterium]
MIFLDANVLLRTFVQPDSPQTRRFSQIAAELLRQAESGEVEVTTSDAVLAEVAFILTAKAHANLPVPVAAGFIASVVQLRGFHHGEKRTILSALEFWTERPRLGFVDALTAAYAQSPGMQLATFDTDFAGLPGIDRWLPGEAG